VLALDTLPDYETVVQSAFEKHIAEHRYGGDQISFLRAVRSRLSEQAHIASSRPLRTTADSVRP